MLTLKEINKLAIPAVLFNITEPLIGLADIAIIGQIDEGATQAQGGVGLAAGLIATLIWGLGQMRTSLSAIISRHYGQGDLKPVYSLIAQTILLTAIIGISVAFFTAYYYNSIAAFIYGSISNDTLQFSNEYFTIRSLGLPLSLIIALFFGIFRGYQNTSWAMTIGLAGGGINIILDLILVLGIDGIIEPMGVAGAAWASVSAQVLMTLLCIVFLYRKTPFNLKISKKLNPFFNEMLMIFWNMFIRTMVLNVVFIMANRYANKNGDIQLAAYTIGYNIWIFSSFFIDGYSNAGNALAGKYLGAKDLITLRALGKKLLSINLLIAGCLCLIYAIFYKALGPIFNDNPMVISAFETTFWIVILSQPFNSIAFTFDGIFKGLGEAVYLRNTLILGTVLIFFPILIYLDFLEYRLNAIWIAMMGWMIYRGGSLLWKFNRMTKNKIH